MEQAFERHLSRRRMLQLGGSLPLALLAACAEPERTPAPTGTPTPTPTDVPTPEPTEQPTPGPNRSGRVLFRDAALADGRSPELQLGNSILVEEGTIRWIRPVDGEEDPGDAEVIDAAGSTIVPGMVDAHAHVTGPGGANWITRFDDPPERLLEYAEHNGQLAWQAGVRWLRDVGSPVRVDPHDGRERALAIGVRDRWHGRQGFPAIRAAGSWITRAGTLPGGLTVEATNADQLLEAALRQLDDGADLVKLYLDGPDPRTSPWTANEVRRVVDAVHRRGARVTAHAGQLDGARVAAEASVDAVEHGFELDAGAAATLARNGVALVTTLTVLHSWRSFGRTTRMQRFASDDGRRTTTARLEMAEASLRAARDAGVTIAAGTDFGGGSSRANQLAWEVESLVAAGLEPVDALAAATWRGGELLGEPDAGVIREGGPADFFLVHGDPLTDPASLWRVWRHA
jgi:imidazolonepropionase-like amidohydrolase